MLRRTALALALVALLAAPASAPAQTPQTTLPDVEDEVMCIVCGVPLALATEAPQANQERDLIRRLIAQGLSKDQIEDRLVAEYGPAVLAIPGDSGFDLAAWIVPGAVIVIAGGAIVVGVRRWRRAGRAAEEEADEEGRGELDPADAERLDADLARYEL